MAFDWNEKIGDYLPLTWAYDNTYIYAVNGVKDGRVGRILHRFFRWWETIQSRVVRYDNDSLDLKEGQVFPMYSGSYWAAIPFRLANRFCTKLYP